MPCLVPAPSPTHKGGALIVNTHTLTHPPRPPVKSPVRLGLGLWSRGPGLVEKSHCGSGSQGERPLQTCQTRLVPDVRRKQSLPHKACCSGKARFSEKVRAASPFDVSGAGLRERPLPLWERLQLWKRSLHVGPESPTWGPRGELELGAEGGVGIAALTRKSNFFLPSGVAYAQYPLPTFSPSPLDGLSPCVQSPPEPQSRAVHPDALAQPGMLKTKNLD